MIKSPLKGNFTAAKVRDDGEKKNRRGKKGPAKKLKNGRWNPTPEVVNHAVTKKERDRLLTEIARLFYDWRCEFGDGSGGVSTAADLLGLKKEVQE